MQDKLIIFSAGVVMKLAQEIAEKWNGENPECPAEVQAGGSVDLVRRVAMGEPCDLLLSADDSIIETMLMPEICDGYYVFAGNRMVVAAMPGRSIDSGNWKGKLLAPEATFFHRDPYGDPGGYRAVMSMMLADYVEPGLAQKLLDHPGHMGMVPGGNPAMVPDCDYIFTYHSGPASAGEPFATLPAEMDLSDTALADIYANARFQVDENNVVIGTPIAHGMAIHKTSRHPEQAKAFARMFLQTDFAARYFIPKAIVVGKWE